MVRVKVHRHRGFAFPVPLWVVGQFLEALADLALIGESVIKRVPLPQDEKARKQLKWVKNFFPSGVLTETHSMIKNLSRYKGLDVVDVEVGKVKVKICIK